MAKKKNNLTLEEKLKNAFDPNEEQPYQIPDNWVWTRLGNIAYLFTGNSISSKVKESKYFGKSKGLSYIATKDISFDHQIDYNNGVRIDDYQNFRIATSNTPLLCIEGGSSGKKIGFVLEDVCFGNKLCAFETQNLNSKLIYYYLQTDIFVNQFNNKRHGLIGGVSIRELSQILIPLPPLLEQQRIVERIESLFSKLDEAKEKIQKPLESFETRKSAILYQAFSGELTQKWREETGIKFDEWEELNLDSVINRVNEKFDPQDNESNYKYIGLEHIEKNNGIIGYGLSEEAKSIKSVFKKGNILYGRLRPYLNKHDIAKFDGICSTDILVYSNKKNCIPEYINFLMDTIGFIEFAIKNSKGINLPRVSDKSLSQYRLLLPPLEEQKEIVRILDIIFEKEHDTQELIDLIENIDLMKKSILSRAFRGELGTNLHKEESAIELLKSVLEV